MATYQRETLEFLPVDVSLTIDGVATQLTTADVADVDFQVLPHGTRPDVDDWVAATVLATDLGIMLTGLTPGIYVVWFRVRNHGPEEPVDKAGVVRVD